MSVIPTIVLPGINPVEITERFNRGEFVNMVIPRIETQIVAPGTIGIRTNYTGNIHDTSFIVHGKSGVETIYHTTNSEGYLKEHNLRSNLDCDSEPIEYECMWCGYKVGPDYLKMPTHTEYTTGPNDEFIIEVYGEGCYCGGRCCLADILEKGKGIRRHDMNYQNSEVVLRMIHHLKYPDEPTLEPAPPKHYLKKHGGTLTREQFLSKLYTYTDVPNIHFLNSKCIVKQENCMNGVSFNGSMLPKNKILNVSRPILTQPRAILPPVSANPQMQVNGQPNTQVVPMIPGLSLPPSAPTPGSMPMQQIAPPTTARNDTRRGNRSILSFM